MSLVFCDGFDDGLLDYKWSSKDPVVAISATPPAGRTGKALVITGAGSEQGVKKRVRPTEEHATFILGGAFRYGAVASSNRIISFYGDGGVTEHVALQHNTNGTLSLLRGAAAVATSVPALLGGSWYYLELKVTVADVGGYAEVRVNGVTWASFTGDTKNAGTKTVLDTVRITRAYDTAASAATYWDDVYLLNGAGTVNNDFLGDVAIETLLPAGNGAASQWVGSDGNSIDNYLLVDDNPVDVADYVQSGVAGAVDSYAMSDLVRTAGSVHGVMATSVASKTDSGAKALKTHLRSGATTASGPATDLSTTYAGVATAFDLDPSGAAWTIATVNGMETGAEVV